MGVPTNPCFTVLHLHLHFFSGNALTLVYANTKYSHCSLPSCSPHHCLAGVILYSCWPTSPLSLGSTHTHTHTYTHLLYWKYNWLCSYSSCCILQWPKVDYSQLSSVCLYVCNFGILHYTSSICPLCSYIPCSLKNSVSSCNKSFNTTLGWLEHPLPVSNSNIFYFFFLPSVLCTEWTINQDCMFLPLNRL